MADDIREIVVSLVAQVLGIPPTEVTDETPIPARAYNQITLNLTMQVGKMIEIESTKRLTVGKLIAACQDKPASTKVELKIVPVQAKCLEEYGCFVAKVCRGEIPVGHPAVAIFNEQETEVVAVATQERVGDEDFYVFALKSQVHGA
jgi:hypothetical protein